MRRLSVALLVFVIFAAGGAFVWWRNGAPLAVRVAQTEKNVEARLFGIGAVEAQVNTRIGFQIAGRIVETGADQGDIPEAGSVLARLDSAVQTARVLKAQVAMQQAETTLSKAQALLARAKVNFQQKQAIAERRQMLVDKGAATREATEEARTQAEIARADVKVAESEVAVAMVARKDLAAGAAIEQAVLDQHTLLAPFRARIISRLKEIGSAVNPAEPVFSLIAPDSVWVRAFIDEASAGALKLGQTAFVRLRSEPHRQVEAEVVRIDEENDRITEERRVYVRCRKCSPEHLGRNLGEQAEVEVVTRILESGLFVPLHAISKYNGRNGLVWIVEDGKLAQRTLAFADRLLDGRVLVGEPLPDGVRVVIDRDASRFSAGRRVHIEGGQP